MTKEIEEVVKAVTPIAKETTKEVVKAVKDSTPDISAKVVEILDQLQTGVVMVGNKAIEYSPDVADAMLWVVRIDGLQQLLLGLACGVLSIFTFKYLKRLWVWGIDAQKNDSSEPYIFIPCFGSGPFLVLWGHTYNSLFDIWNWVQVFEPKLYLAKQVITKVLN